MSSTDTNKKPYKKRFGDRKDARYLRDIDSFHKLLPYVMPKRCDAEVYMARKFDVTELLAYVKERKKLDDVDKLTFFHAVLTAVAKTVYFRPYLNRYIINKRTYQRHEISLGFTAKKFFADHAEEGLVTMVAEDNDNLISISNKITKEVTKVRSEEGNSIEGLINTFMKLPRFFLKFFFWLLRRLENHGMMPSALTEGDTNYVSVMLSNLGSIKCDAIYHHLNEYGTNGVVITVGEIKKTPVEQPDGTVAIRDICEFGITLDERIADGYYFIKSANLIEYYFKHPETLEAPISEEVRHARKNKGTVD